MRLAGVVLLALACASNTLASVAIHRIAPATGTYPAALALSNGGAVVVGGYDPTGVSGGTRAYSWTLAGGFQSLPGISTSVVTRANGISADGSVIVGNEDNHGFRWTASTGAQSIGFLPGGNSSQALGVSADGMVIGGYGHTAGNARAIRWTPAGGMQSLGSLPPATDSYGAAISGDGTTVVGSVQFSAPEQAIRWSAGTGMQGLGRSGAYSSATAVSANGSVITGRTQEVGSGTQVGFRWTQAGGLQLLPKLPGATTHSALGISSDGSAIVGSTNLQAFLWTQSLGTVDLEQYLTGQGLDLTGWDLTTARAISPDGTAICGEGYYQAAPFSFVASAWVVTGLTPIPAPGTSAPFMVLGLALARRRRRRGTRP